MTAEEFERCMAVLIAGVGKPMPREQIDIWREFFADMSFADLKRGIVNCLRDYKYAGFPPVGLIRQAAGVSGGVVDADSAAVLAWDKVLKAIKYLGAYVTVEWDDGAIPGAIETIAGSWVQLCEQTSEQLTTWTRKAFCDAYKAHKTAQTPSTGTSQGLLASDAGRLGFEPPEPIRIGQEPPAAYGFGGGQLLTLTGPVGDIPRLTDELVKRMPQVEPDSEIEPPPELTPEEFVARKAAMSHALKVRFAMEQSC
jgi:hypothetical protein